MNLHEIHLAHLRDRYPAQVAEGRTNIGWGVTATGIASRVEGVGTVQTELVNGEPVHSVKAE